MGARHWVRAIFSCRLRSSQQSSEGIVDLCFTDEDNKAQRGLRDAPQVTESEAGSGPCPKQTHSLSLSLHALTSSRCKDRGLCFASVYSLRFHGVTTCQWAWASAFSSEKRGCRYLSQGLWGAERTWSAS